MARGHQHWWSEPPWWAWVLMVLGAAFLAVGVPIASQRGNLSQAEIARIEAAHPSTVAAEERPVAAFLGDSYTEGVGDGAGYVPATAEAMGWEAANFGQASTGYINPGTIDPANSGTYSERVADVVAAEPDVVIIQGSTNDTSDERGAVHAAATELYAALKGALPDARLVVVGPVRPPSKVDENVDRIAQELSAAALEAGLPFIDPIALGWLPTEDATLFTEDQLHPSAEGYRRYADGLVAELRRVVAS